MIYGFFYFAGFFIRQFVLPNPFAPFGDNAEIINLIFGGFFILLSYFMVGLIYDKGSEPVVGCFLFNFIYAVNTVITCLVCRIYPAVWLMILVAVIYLAVYLFAAFKIREHGNY